LLGDLNHDKNEKRKTLQKHIDGLSVQLEAIDMRLADLEKDAFAFKRDVLTQVGGSGRSSNKLSTSYIVNQQDRNDPIATASLENSAFTATTATLPLLHPIKSEKLVRYFQSKSIQLDSTKDKLKLQQADQSNKLQKIKSKLRQESEDSTEVDGKNGGRSNNKNFDHIDFHTFRTENVDYKKELETKTNELEKAKVLSKKSENKLSKLILTAKEHEKVERQKSNEIQLRQRHLKRLEDNMQRLKDTMDDIKSKESNDKDDTEEAPPSCKMKESDNRRRNHDKDKKNVVVEVMDFVKQQSELYELQALMKTWTRKVEIAQLSKMNFNAKK
jgi:hypothetical protein